MRNVELYADGWHRFVLLNESDPGSEDGIRSNQYLITRNNVGVMLDPGGFGVMPHVLAELLRHIRPERIRGIVLSHQDPDIVGGLATWLELTPARVYVSRIWMRFLPHYGLKDMERFVAVPDTGMEWNVAPDFQLTLVPAHFLHSEGQINVYDPISKILFSGDIGSATMPPDRDEAFVRDFSEHVPYIERFHKRFMNSNRAIRCWLETIADLDIAMIAPQHGPIYTGSNVQAFLDWFKDLRCGTDLLLPGGRFEMGDSR